MPPFLRKWLIKILLPDFVEEGNSFNGRGWKNYRDALIDTRRALSALKRGKPTDIDMEILGFKTDDFSNTNEYMAAYSFNVKERERFIKSLHRAGVDIFDVAWLKMQLDEARHYCTKYPNDKYYEAAEMVLGNLLYNRITPIPYNHKEQPND